MLLVSSKTKSKRKAPKAKTKRTIQNWKVHFAFLSKSPLTFEEIVIQSQSQPAARNVLGHRVPHETAKVYSLLAGQKLPDNSYDNDPALLKLEKKTAPPNPKNKVRVGVLSVEPENEIDQRNILIKTEHEKELVKTIMDPKHQSVFGFDELTDIKNKYTSCIDKSPYLSRDQFIAFMPKVFSLQNKKLIDQLFVYITRIRPKILGPKIPLTSVSFGETIECLEEIFFGNPFRLFLRKGIFSIK